MWCIRSNVKLCKRVENFSFSEGLFQNSVHKFPERARGEISTPIMIIAVGVSEKVTAKAFNAARNGWTNEPSLKITEIPIRIFCSLLGYRFEIIVEGSKFSNCLERRIVVDLLCWRLKYEFSSWTKRSNMIKEKLVVWKLISDFRFIIPTEIISKRNEYLWMWLILKV